MKKNAPRRPPKFVQIATVTRGSGPVHLYALDANGRVWTYEGNTTPHHVVDEDDRWVPLSEARET